MNARNARIAEINLRMAELYAEGWTCLVARGDGPETAISPDFEALSAALPFPDTYHIRWIPPSAKEATAS